MMTQFPLSGPMSVGDLLDRAFRLYRARFGVFLLTAAIFLVPVWIVISLISPDYSDIDSLLIILAFMLANGCAILALSARIVEELHGRTLSIHEGIRRGLRQIAAYADMTVAWIAMIAATTAVAYYIVLLVAISAAGVLRSLTVPIAADSLFVEIGSTVLLICGVVLSLILIFLPSHYLYSRWLAAPAVLIAERPGPLGALGRSWDLSRGQHLRVTGYTALLFLLMALGNILPLALLEVFFLELPPDFLIELSASILVWASFLLWVISAPFYVCAVVLLYYDLRIRNEGYDLELRLAEMEAQVARKADWERAAVDAGAGRAS